MAVRRDLIIEAGSTERWSLVWRQPPLASTPTGMPGDPYDLNSATARLQIRTKPHRQGQLLLELTEHTGNGLVLGGTSGEIVIILTAAQTSALLRRRVFYDLFVTLANGDVHKVLYGHMKVEPNVTAPSTGIDPPLAGVTIVEGGKAW